MTDKTSKANRIAHDLPIRGGTLTVTVWAPQDLRPDEAAYIGKLLGFLAVPESSEESA